MFYVINLLVTSRSAEKMCQCFRFKKQRRTILQYPYLTTKIANVFKGLGRDQPRLRRDADRRRRRRKNILRSRRNSATLARKKHFGS